MSVAMKWRVKEGKDSPKVMEQLRGFGASFQQEESCVLYSCGFGICVLHTQPVEREESGVS